jgi:PAS domain S-box-containing protein
MRLNIPFDFEAVFETMPGCSALLAVDAPRFTVVSTTRQYRESSVKQKEEILGLGFFEAFPRNSNGPEKLVDSFRKVISSKKPDQYILRHDIVDNKGNFKETTYRQATNSPVLDTEGEMMYIVHTIEDATDKVITQKQNENLKGLQQAYNLFMQAPEGICILKGEDLVVDLANDPVLKMWGKNRMVIGQPLLKAIPELENQGFIELLHNVRKTGTPFTASDTPVILVRDGKQELVYFNFTYQPYYEDDHDAAVGVLVFGTEVTEKVEAARQIRENEARYRTLIEEATVATALYVGSDLTIQYVNDIMIGYWGKDNSIVGKKLLDAVPELRGHFGNILNNVYTTGIAYTGTEELAMLMISGTLQAGYYNFTYKALRNRNGEIYGIHHMAIDVTEQVLARKRTEESERKYRELSQSLEQKIDERTAMISQLIETFQYSEQTGKFGSYRYDFDTKVLTYSDNLYRLLGCEPGEFPASGEEFLKFVHPDDRDFVRHATNDAFNKQQITSWEYRLVRKDGQHICVRGTANIITDTKGQIHMIGTLQDVTDEKNKEQLLHEKNESLMAMNKELESFAYISSHDLQEPLRKIQTFASRVIDSEYEKLSENAKSYFARMQSAALRMQTLIDDLLAYSRTNSEERRFEKVHLGEIIDEIREEINEDLEVYQATIETGTMCDLSVIPFQFRQVMHNLIGNALKFSRHERPPHIHINCEINKGLNLGVTKLEPQLSYAHIRISDNGIGFEPEYGERIFEVFQRLHSRDRYNGTGIGLAIVKKIIENHHGVIRAKGEVNKGATFDIYIPSPDIFAK